MKAIAVVAVGVVLSFVPVATSANAAALSPCMNPNSVHCDQGSVTADQAEGDFHGLIMVPGQPGVLDRAAHSGTQPGCGDCTWTLIMMCLTNLPGASHDQTPCVGASGSRLCRPRQTAFRLYLTTDAVTNELVDTLCLGGTEDV